MVHYTVEAILEGLKTSDSEVLQFVYRKYFPSIRFFVIKNSGTNEDAKDLFQEALILIYKKLKEGTLNLVCSFKTYLYSVCRFLWLQILRKRNVHRELSDNQVFVELEVRMEEEFKEQERFRMYQRHFKMLHKDCQEILRLHA